MSAIYGVCRWDGGAAETEDLTVMGQVLQERGNGPAKAWTERGVGLGNCLLATTLESLSETLPFHWRETGLCITADARIDNRETLLGVLDVDRKTSRVVTDSELILRAYQKWGETCPEKLLGDFAFAIWDERKQTLFCARDHFGIRPFFMCWCDGALYFASDFAALLALSKVPDTVNRTKVAHFLAWMSSDDEITFYQSVHKLCPAHAMSVRDGKAKIAQYYQIPPGAEMTFKDDEECAAAFREVFGKAIQRRTRNPGPMACMLSGGLDSSAIACMAEHLSQSAGRGPVHTFSNTYEQVPECDESPYIQSVLERGGYAAHPRPVGIDRSMSDLEALTSKLGEPTHALGLFGNGDIYEFVRKAGFNAILDGHGGDEVLSNPHAILRELAVKNRWIELALEYRPWLQADGTPFWQPYLSALLTYGLPAQMRRKLRLGTRWRSLRKQTKTPSAKWPQWAVALDPRFAAEEDVRAQQALWQAKQPQAILNARLSHLHTLTYTGQAVAFEQLGRMAAANGVEPLYPLWDKDVVEFCVALPRRLKLHRGLNRVIIRESLRGILPEKVRLRRDKNDFSPQVAASIKSVGEDQIRSLWSDHFPGSETINSTWYQDMVSQFFRGKEPLGINFPHFWDCISLLIWLKVQETGRRRFHQAGKR